MKDFRIFRKSVLLLLVPFFILTSCEKEPTPLAGDVDLQVRSGQPDQPGDNLKVFRFEGTYTIRVYDADQDLFAWVGIDIPAFCSGDPEGRDVLEFQDVVKGLDLTTGEFEKVIRQIKGDDVSVFITDYPGNSCAGLVNNEVFSSSGRMVFTDNDFFAFDNENKNRNAYGFTLIGEDIKIIARFVWDGLDTESTKQTVKIKL